MGYLGEIKQKARRDAGPSMVQDGSMAAPCRRRASIRGADVGCLLSLRAGRDVEAHALAFLQGLEALLLNGGEMREEILAAVGGRNESETLCIVEPLDGTCCHDYFP